MGCGRGGVLGTITIITIIIIWSSAIPIDILKSKESLINNVNVSRTLQPVRGGRRQTRVSGRRKSVTRKTTLKTLTRRMSSCPSPEFSRC